MLLRDYLEEYYSDQAVRYLAGMLEISDEETIEKMNRSDLIDRDVSALLTPERIISRLSVLNEKEIKIFERACQGPVQLSADEEREGYQIDASRYAFLSYTEETAKTLPSADSLSEDQTTFLNMAKVLKRFTSNRLEVPEDVASLYNQINTPEFQNQRRMTSCLVHCVEVCRKLYGSVPVSVLRRMMEQELDGNISEEKILSLFEKIPSDSKFSSYDSAANRVHDISIQDEELAELTAQQKDRDFYIPSSAEIQELYIHEYLPESPSYACYRKFLENYCYLDDIDAFEAGFELWNQIAGGKPYQECLQEMIDWSGADSAYEKLIRTMYRNCYYETRVHMYCGHTPLEMKVICPADNAQEKFSLGFDDTIKPVRIGRNDPCPCGSGKKFKKCCMR